MLQFKKYLSTSKNITSNFRSELERNMIFISCTFELIAIHGSQGLNTHFSAVWMTHMYVKFVISQDASMVVYVCKKCNMPWEVCQCYLLDIPCSNLIEMYARCVKCSVAAIQQIFEQACDHILEGSPLFAFITWPGNRRFGGERTVASETAPLWNSVDTGNDITVYKSGVS